MGQPGSFAQIPPVTLPAIPDASGLPLALLHNTLTQCLPGAGLPPGRLRRGTGCWQTRGRGKPAQVLGADGGTERDSRACRFWNWAQGQSSITVRARPPGHQPLMPSIPQIMAL